MGQQFLSHETALVNWLDLMMENKRFAGHARKWAATETSTGIHLEFRHAHKALRPILACSSESVTADKLKSFSLRRLLAQLALLLPLSIQMLCAISNTSTDDPLDARGCRALGKKGRAREPPVASSALSAAVLGDAETEDNLVDPEEGTMGYNPCYVVEDGVVLNPWVPPEPGESGPLPLRLGIIAMVLLMLIYARNQQLNLAQQFFGLWAKAARASARLLRGLSGLGIVVDRSTTYHSMRVMARNAAEKLKVSSVPQMANCQDNRQR